MSAKAWLDRFFALFFPDRCAFCNRVMKYCEDGLCICDDCKRELVFSADVPTCRICGRRISDGETLCDICSSHPHSFDKALCCLTYEFSVRESILKFKFGNRIDHARTYSALICNRIAPFLNDFAFDFIVCAPLSKKGFNERGFNQAAEIARPVAKSLHIPFRDKAFLKIKETPKQSTLHYAERFKNVADAFRLNLAKEQVKGKTVLLIDDVLTTGATADSLSRLLKNAGAKAVVVAVVAGTEPDRADKPIEIDWDELTF